jgi:hypothetical protein
VFSVPTLLNEERCVVLVVSSSPFLRPFALVVPVVVGVVVPRRGSAGVSSPCPPGRRIRRPSTSVLSPSSRSAPQHRVHPRAAVRARRTRAALGGVLRCLASRRCAHVRGSAVAPAGGAPWVSLHHPFIGGSCPPDLRGLVSSGPAGRASRALWPLRHSLLAPTRADARRRLATGERKREKGETGGRPPGLLLGD